MANEKNFAHTEDTDEIVGVGRRLSAELKMGFADATKKASQEMMKAGLTVPGYIGARAVLIQPDGTTVPDVDPAPPDPGD
jgi:hypothetical protein